MPRSARLIIPNQVHHIFQRGNNGQNLFLDSEDDTFFLNWLKEGSRQFKVDIHAYALLNNCFHVLVTPDNETGLAKMMQWVGRYYVPYFNKKYQRTGTLWEGRYRTSIVEDIYLMKCSQFIEMKPYFSGLTENPENYLWSSLSHHLGIKANSLIRDHVVYWNLGNTPFAREAAYKDLVEPYQTPESMKLDQILLNGWLLGSEEFKKNLEMKTQRCFRMGKRGRPAKQ